MDVEGRIDDAAAHIAAAIGEPARARMLYCLMDGRARTGTELAVVAEISPSTASVHLNRLKEERLVQVAVQGKHRYYRLDGPDVARVLEGLNALAGGSGSRFVPRTPGRLRAARTCYDHIAGSLGVALFDRLLEAEWLRPEAGGGACDLTPKGCQAVVALGIDVAELRALRRRFAFGCLDWSERRFHLGGALGASLLQLAQQRKWVALELDSRALSVTRLGRAALREQLGVRVPDVPSRVA